MTAEADHDHGHADGPGHGDCCGHDHADGHDHAHSEAHSHGHSHASAPAAAAEEASDRWLSAKQYKGIGKYLKPWGKPPTGTTFWIQIITTAAVIIISILKGVDSTVALVVSNGPASVNQAQENPMVLASGIVFALFAAALGAGYLMHRWQSSRPQKEEKEAAEEREQPVDEKKAAKAEKKAARKAEKAAKEKESPTMSKSREKERAEQMVNMERELNEGRQQILAQCEAEGKVRPRALEARGPPPEARTRAHLRPLTPHIAPASAVGGGDKGAAVGARAGAHGPAEADEAD